MNDNREGKTGYLTGVKAFFIPLRSKKLQLLMWKNHLKEAGGEISKVCDKKTTHIIVGAGYSSSAVFDQLRNKNIATCPMGSDLTPKVVSHFWLSTCFQRQRFEEEEGFCLYEKDHNANFMPYDEEIAH